MSAVCLITRVVFNDLIDNYTYTGLFDDRVRTFADDALATTQTPDRQTVENNNLCTAVFEVYPCTPTSAGRN